MVAAPICLTFDGFRQPPALPAQYEQTTRNRLMSAVQAIHLKNHPDDSLEELYRACENLCLHYHAEALYDCLKAELTNQVAQVFQALQRDIIVPSAPTTADPGPGLMRMHTAWHSFTTQVRLIRSIFLFLDRTYVLQHPSLLSVWDLALDLFRQQWLDHTALRNAILQKLMVALAAYRDGQSPVDSLVLHSLIHMYIDLAVYPTGFEFTFLEHTRTYYTHESSQHLANLSGSTDAADRVANYLKHVERRFHEEERLALHFLHRDSTKPLMKVLYEALLIDPIQTLIANGLPPLLAGQRLDDLRRFYTLLQRVWQLNPLRTAYGQYVETTGRAIVCATDHDDTMVENLIQLKQAQDRILTQCFANDDHYVETLRNSFEHLINARPNRPAQLIAKFLDSTLRSGNKTMSDDQLEQILNHVLSLFRYLQGKDVFEAFYKRDLSRRLLYNKSASFDAEKSMLAKLKVECGAEFTHKLEGMFKDMEISRDLMADFRPARGGELQGKQRGKRPLAHGYDENPSSADASPHFSVSVLTQSYWPTYPPCDGLILPPEVADYKKQFQKYYLKKHSSRNLTWQDSLDTCVLRVPFTAGKKELSLTCYQALVLLLFQDGQERSYAQIQHETGIQDNDELIRTLQSLSGGRYRILTKNPADREVVIPASDRFSFNDGFTAPLYRLKINAIQFKETTQETETTTEKVVQDRQHQVDAAIVRLMKAHKNRTHTQLMNDLFQSLQFPISAADLKKRIDILIDRDYMERDSEDANLYRYLA
ncbi:hypothetical protein H4R33_001816 [Dimargaris cristalligena]|nr:hypothetical protein H4R33_001816 [Dimargaris cristalligena]